MPEQDLSHSEEIQDILTQMPGWTMRWGISAIALCVALLVAASAYVSYPDIVHTRLKIVSDNPPVKIVAKTSGRIVELLVEDKESVLAGDAIGVIENPARYDDVRILQRQLDDLDLSGIAHLGRANFTFRDNMILGELQTQYSEFLQLLHGYSFAAQSNYAAENIRLLRSQLDYTQSLGNKLQQQRDIAKQDAELSQKNYDSQKLLKNKGHVSDQELSQYESILLQKKMMAENLESAVITNALKLADLQNSLNDSENRSKEKLETLAISVRESVKSLSASIAVWMEKYVLRTPSSGIVSFDKVWSAYQYVNMGEEMAAVIPESQKIIGKGTLTQKDVAKVQPGALVNIKLDNYPYYEFGVVKGKILSVALSPTNSQYAVTIVLPAELLTSHGKTVEFRQEMEGMAEIITQDVRLLERMFYQFRSLWQ